ncbi:MAG: alpha/beta hydrolase, partial [Xenococcus sp. (in: cyanobacteria)]
YSASSSDLEAVREAILKSYDDDRRISIIELLSEYPKRRIEIDLTGLEGTFNDINQLVERIIPIWEVAKSLLEDVVCDCEQPQ